MATPPNSSRLQFAIALSAALSLFWLLLSGFGDDGLLLALGAASVALSVWLAWRMDVLSPAEHDFRLLLRLPVYWAWLFWQVVLSNIDVVKRIWLPGRYPISPTCGEVKATQRSAVGRALYANSITLTPGTVTVNIVDDTFTVHALSKEGFEGVRGGDMDRRCTRVEQGGAD